MEISKNVGMAIAKKEKNKMITDNQAYFLHNHHTILWIISSTCVSYHNS